MSQPDLVPGQRFYCFAQDKVEGPFDLIELAGMLKVESIDAETPVCREGEESWIPLHDWPEFASLQEIPVEEIARHMEAKERAAASSSTRSPISSYLWIILALVIVFAGIAGIQALGSFTSPEAKITPLTTITPLTSDKWLKTEKEHFSVLCPVLLERVASTDPENTIIYQGVYQKTTVSSFVVVEDTKSFPNTYSLPPAMVTMAMKGAVEELAPQMQKLFLDKIHAQIVSEHDFDENGYYVHETFAVSHVGDVSRKTGYRFVIGNGRIFFILALMDANDFTSDDMNRFLTSFKPH